MWVLWMSHLAVLWHGWCTLRLTFCDPSAELFMVVWAIDSHCCGAITLAGYPFRIHLLRGSSLPNSHASKEENLLCLSFSLFCYNIADSSQHWFLHLLSSGGVKCQSLFLLHIWEQISGSTNGLLIISSSRLTTRVGGWKNDTVLQLSIFQALHCKLFLAIGWL